MPPRFLQTQRADQRLPSGDTEQSHRPRRPLPVSAVSSAIRLPPRFCSLTASSCATRCQKDGPPLTDTLFILYKELVASSGRHSFALQGIIVHLELCSPPSTSVPWGRGASTAAWKPKGSASRAHRAGTAWLGLDLRLADAALDTSVQKVDTHECQVISKSKVSSVKLIFHRCVLSSMCAEVSVNIIIWTLRHQGLHTVLSSLVPGEPTASRWVTGAEKTA